MIKQAGEHSFDETLLPRKANILDLGCRGFAFTNYLISNGHNVYPVDCDILEPYQPYYRVAITNINGTVNVMRTGDPQGTYIVSHQRGEDAVTALTLESFSDLIRVPFWDLIKMDIESSEYEVIMNMRKAIAKQLSIEFHLHMNAYGGDQVKEMEDKLLSLGYFPAKHDMTRQHGLNENYWDSLWILKDLMK